MRREMNDYYELLILFSDFERLQGLVSALLHVLVTARTKITNYEMCARGIEALGRFHPSAIKILPKYKQKTQYESMKTVKTRWQIWYPQTGTVS